MQNKISKIHTKYLRYTHLQCAFDDFTNSYRHVLLELKIPFQVQVGVCTSICCNALYSMVLLYGNDVCLFFCLFFQSTNGSFMSNKKKILETFILSFTSSSFKKLLHIRAAHEPEGLDLYFWSHLLISSLLSGCLMLLLSKLPACNFRLGRTLQ